MKIRDFEVEKQRLQTVVFKDLKPSVLLIHMEYVHFLQILVLLGFIHSVLVLLGFYVI